MISQYPIDPRKREIWPGHGTMEERAKSVEDVCTYFEHMAAGVLIHTVGDMIDVRQGDVLFDPYSIDGYRLSSRLERNPKFMAQFETSDLKRLLARIADRAVCQYRHLVTERPDTSIVKAKRRTGPKREPHADKR